MTVLSDVNDHRLLPAKQEVSGASTGSHSDAQVPVVGHEDEHQEIADNNLDDVKQCLQKVGWTQHPLPGREVGPELTFDMMLL